MNKKTIGIIVAIIVIALIGFYMIDNSPSEMANEMREEAGEMMEKMDGDKMEGEHDDDSMMMEDKEDGDSMMMHSGETTYLAVLANSSLGWRASRVVGNPHVGEVEITSGSVTRVDDQFTGGEFVINMEAISEEGNNARFLGHIASEDFFAVETYPTARFVITNVAKLSDGNYRVTGDLTILGQTNEISFPATLAEADGKLMVDAQFDIDRTRWGINYDSGSIFQQLGDKAIEDEINYTLHLELMAS